MNDKIITFSCSKSIYVYKPNSSVLPRFPFKSHKSIELAEEHLKNRGIEKPQIIIKT